MTRMHRWVAVGLCATLACAGAEDPVHEGEHVTLSIDPALEPCGDLLGHMDRSVASVADYFGISLADLHLTFIWYSVERYLANSGCDEFSRVCTSGTTIRTTAAPFDFELARLVLGWLGSPPSFFAVGAAMVSSDSPAIFVDSQSPGWGEVQDVLALGNPLPTQHYNLAGGFTRFLIDRHGLAAYREFYAGLHYRDSLPQIEAVHAQKFGESLTETVLAFEAEDRRTCPKTRFRLKLNECSAPEIAWDDDSLLLRRSLTCGDADVIGPFGDHTARVYATLEVATAGYFELNLASDELDTTALLAGCGGCEDETAVELRVGGEPVRVWIPAGRYFLQLSGEVALSSTAALSLRRVEGP